MGWDSELIQIGEQSSKSEISSCQDGERGVDVRLGVGSLTDSVTCFSNMRNFLSRFSFSLKFFLRVRFN